MLNIVANIMCNLPYVLQLNNALKVLGLYEVSNTLVGDASIRGISGGQKRRVTLGEMLMPPRPIKFLDSISNGLDAATTYDIVQALRFLTHNFGSTTVISLLQVSSSYMVKKILKLTKSLNLFLFSSLLRMCSTASRT